MNINPDDPKWTAYVLGELSDADRARVEKELESSAVAREIVEEIRLATGLLRQELAKEALAKFGPEHLAKAAEAMAEAIHAKRREHDMAVLDERYGWIPDGRGGEVNMFSTMSRPYVASPKGPGAKELRRRVKREVLALRGGR